MPRSSPPPPTSLRRCARSRHCYPEWSSGGGGQVRGTSAHLTTQWHTPSLATPSSGRVPTRTTFQIGVVRVGAGAWGVEQSLPQLHPTLVKGVPRPSDARADGGSSPFTRVGWGLGGRLIFQQALWFWCPTLLPPDPPPSCIILCLICEHPY